MVRAPCCEKMGLKKGPWTPEEDQILINYIQQYGHSNWRALPKQAGLLRCGKSCRLRWTNYLRPDIKRGNFTREEEETIISLHEMLGNRWSAIAARLPGRTDNEIKNVWHTHLKKRLVKQNNNVTIPELERRSIENKSSAKKNQDTNNSSLSLQGSKDMAEYRPISPQQSSSDISSVTTGDESGNNMSMKVESSSLDDLPELIDENFWSEVLSSDNSNLESDFPREANSSELQLQMPYFSLGNINVDTVQFGSNSSTYDSMDFWYNLFTRAEGSLEIPEI